MRIVYMGTPEFAVESLKRLVEGGYQVVAVVTMPDKPMGRHGSVLQGSPVKEYAVSQGLKVLQPVNLKDEAFVEELRALKADLQIVVAFRMLPEVVWNMPPMGTFNLHAALLPQYRGAAPINWAVINGDTETGITTFFFKHEIDTGDIIQQVRVPIADTDNVEIVYVDGVMTNMVLCNPIANLKEIKNIPYKINKHGLYVVRGVLHNLDFYVTDVIDGGYNNINKNLKELIELGFDVVQHFAVNLNPRILKDIIDYIFDYLKEEELMCDGVVFRFNDISCNNDGIVYEMLK